LKNILIISGSVFLLLFGGCNGEHTPEEYPNIVVVLADDLGYGDLSSFNEDGKIVTSHIDQLASEGMRFTDAHTSSSVCTPTRYGLLTGRYNWRTRLKSGVLNGRSTALIREGRATLASMLKEHGYHTAFIGKWHLGWDWALQEPAVAGEPGQPPVVDFSQPVTHSPNDLGFAYAYGHSGSLDMPPYVYVENGMPTAVPDTITANKDRYSWWREGLTAPDFDHEDVTPNFFRRAISYIESRAREQAPFFLYLALPSPHTPILPTAEWQGRSGLNPYGDFVLMVDHYMGQLLRVMDEAGVKDNTLLIFTSDNGCSPRADFELLAEKGHHPSYIFRGYKADIFEGGHRVPFIARWPERITAGSVSDEVICITDLMATFAEITGYDLQDNEAEDSYSLLPLLEGKKLEEPLREATVHHSIKGNFAIRKGDWKLIFCPGSGGWSFPRPGRNDDVIDTLPPLQLYNLKDDPGETKNLQDQYPEKVKELKTLLLRYIEEGRSTPGASQKNDPVNRPWQQLDELKKLWS
jgi:arylsulfatase A-like enzyme